MAVESLTARNGQAGAEKTVAGSKPAPAGWLTRLIECEGPGIVRMLWRMLRREADVADAFQDTCCKLAALPDPSTLSHARAYAYRTAANTAIEMIRSRSRRALRFAHFAAQRVQHEADDEELTVAPVNSMHLQRAIVELPTHLRQVLILRDFSRMPYKEVGKLLGIDPATARVYRRHAVVRLAEILSGSMVAGPALQAGVE